MCIITNKQNGKFSDFSSGLLRSARNDDVPFYSYVSRHFIFHRRHCEVRSNPENRKKLFLIDNPQDKKVLPFRQRVLPFITTSNATLACGYEN